VKKTCIHPSTSDYFLFLNPGSIMDNLAALWILAAVLVCVGLAGVVLPAVPGTIFLFSGLIFAAWAEDFRYVGLGTIIVLVLLTILTYIIDIVAAALGARQFGASKRAAIGATLGAVIGIFFGLPGILMGPFLGAVAGELLVHDDILQAGKAGVGAWLGLLLGVAVKLALSFAMIGVFIAARFL
jgi:hypothetical protein